MAVIPANLIENNISNLQTLSIELKWLWYQMGVSYKVKSAGKCKHWGGSIIRLQIHKCFRSTSVDCKLGGNRSGLVEGRFISALEKGGILAENSKVRSAILACWRLRPRVPYIGGGSLGCLQEIAGITEGKLLLLRVNCLVSQKQIVTSWFCLGHCWSEQ